jgi:hypothetical protein
VAGESPDVTSHKNGPARLHGSHASPSPVRLGFFVGLLRGVLSCLSAKVASSCVLSCIQPAVPRPQLHPTRNTPIALKIGGPVPIFHVRVCP